ncbi:hypothetical protein AVEN_41045-1 [Araneus ventricosus]|uniref:Transposable element Tc3 transposase n=1 Tax=Araneus ventricosus TaxID=182803 RepID=A0A4Y2CLN7_ARAVE|nr:hypothetical protein AVEN_41045-1 [Araneus ventricosus]
MSRPRVRRVAGSKPDSTEDPPCMAPVARQIIRSGQTSYHWCGAEAWRGGASSEDLSLSDLRNVRFQHDGAPPHKVSSVQKYLRDTFQQQVIGYGGCVEWAPRSPDLNPLNFFLWGYIKQRVYATPPPTFQELRNRITVACASVSSAFLNNVQREVQSRVQMCTVAEGHHFEHDR